MPKHFDIEPFDSNGVTRWRATLDGRKEIGYGVGPSEALEDLKTQLVNALSGAM